MPDESSTTESSSATKMPAPTNEDVLKKVLGHLDVADGFYENVLLSSRCRSLTKAMAYNMEQREMIKMKVKKLDNVDYDLDLMSFFQMIDAAKFHMEANNTTTVRWSEITVEIIEKMNMEYERHKAKEKQATQVNPSPVEFMSNGSVSNGTLDEISSTYAKRSLNAFKDCKMPTNPISTKEMRSFKIRVKNILRSMGLDNLLDEDYVPPEEGEAGYAYYMAVNKFLYSVWIDVTSNPDHEARNWLLKKEVANDGRKAWVQLMENYDSETIQSSLIPTTMTKWVNTKLDETSLGAAKTFITNFATSLSTLKEEGAEQPEACAKAIFLNNITDPSYTNLVMECRVRQFSLNEC